jgi:gamma-glutamylcyclotransferase (GGCT)/AIG2-like uncharacterized protein YtfP
MTDNTGYGADETAMILVYGTLMREGCNHVLMSTAQYLGIVETEPGYELVDLGPFPAMTEGGSSSVFGELYHVDAVTLAALDELEDHPNLYTRKTIRLRDGRKVQAYIMSPEKTIGYSRIPSGRWSDRHATIQDVRAKLDSLHE